MAGGGEDGHVGADLGEDDLGGAWADAGDLVDAVDQVEQSGSAGGGWCGGWVGVGQVLFDPGGEAVDFGGEGVDHGQ
ncbi:hypothetical protein ACFQZC_04495 [Streptacidiphilus monticola]